jgi:hypothetical protein
MQGAYRRPGENWRPGPIKPHMTVSMTSASVDKAPAIEELAIKGAPDA